MKNIIKYFKDDAHVILCGDFNSQGPYYADSVAWADREPQLGMAEFDVFLYGFTDNGTFYPGGYTLANHGNWGDFPTSNATGSRPDVDRPPLYYYLDNILTKGFRMSGVTRIDDGTITDHCGVFCDLTLL